MKNKLGSRYKIFLDVALYSQLYTTNILSWAGKQVLKVDYGSVNEE
jgi:hypothetical protein